MADIDGRTLDEKLNDKRLRQRAHAIVAQVGGDIIASDGMQTEKRFLQHGATTTFRHSMSVAHFAVMLAEAFGVTDSVDMRRLVVSALLHDYYLYDWHEPAPWHSLHGFTHGHVAMRNAIRDFGTDTIDPIVAEAINRHMFPLTITPPNSLEGWLVTMADKTCAVRETCSPRRFNRAEAISSRLTAALPNVPSIAKPIAAALADGGTAVIGDGGADAAPALDGIIAADADGDTATKAGGDERAVDAPRAAVNAYGLFTNLRSGVADGWRNGSRTEPRP